MSCFVYYLQDAKDLKRRKLINVVTRKSFKVTRGPKYAPNRVKKSADLTKEMLDSGSWQTAEFKEYNFLTLGEKVGGGYLHPLLKVRAEFRKILMEMVRWFLLLKSKSNCVYYHIDT